MGGLFGQSLERYEKALKILWCCRLGCEIPRGARWDKGKYVRYAYLKRNTGKPGSQYGVLTAVTDGQEKKIYFSPIETQNVIKQYRK